MRSAYPLVTVLALMPVLISPTTAQADAGSALAASVVADTSGSGVDDSSCARAGATPATAVPIRGVVTVCAAVFDALGQPLVGRSVQFAATTGGVGPQASALPVDSAYATTTDRAGDAFAAVTSSSPGTQDLVVTVDQLTGHGSIDWEPLAPASLVLQAAAAPRAGATELVAAVVKAADGSAVADEVVHFAVSGADLASGGVSTKPNGVALFGFRAQRSGRDVIRAWDDANRDGRRESVEPGGSLRLRIAAARRKK